MLTILRDHETARSRAPRVGAEAAPALRQLDDAYAAWIAGVRGLDAEIALLRDLYPYQK